MLPAILPQPGCARIGRPLALRRQACQPTGRGVAISEPLRPREAVKLPGGFEAAANLGDGANEPAALLHLPQRLATGAHAGELEAALRHGAPLAAPRGRARPTRPT